VLAKVELRLKKTFKPEFINRLDAIVFFKTLDKEVMSKIVGLRMKEVFERLYEQSIKAEITEKAVDYLAQKGYDRLFGARPVRRVIEKEVEAPIADMIIDGTLNEGDKITIDADEFGIRIVKE